MHVQEAHAEVQHMNDGMQNLLTTALKIPEVHAEVRKMNAGMQNLISELGSCYPRSLPSKENHYERGRGSGTFTAPSAGTQPTLDIVPPSPLSQASDSWLIEDLSDTESHRRSEQACPGFVEFLQESVPSSPFSQASNCWRIGDLFETERHEQSEQA